MPVNEPRVVSIQSEAKQKQNKNPQWFKKKKKEKSRSSLLILAPLSKELGSDLLIQHFLSPSDLVGLFFLTGTDYQQKRLSKTSVI